MSLPVVAILTPCYGSQCFTEYTASLIETVELFTKRGIGYKIFFVSNESLIPRARNNLIAKAMAVPEVTHLMFIDADISWNAEDLYSMVMLSHVNSFENTSIDVIGGVYPKKTLYFSRMNEQGVNDIANNLSNKKVNDDTYTKNLVPQLLSYVVDSYDNTSTTADKTVEEVKYIGTGFMLIRRNVIEKMIEAHRDTFLLNPTLNNEEKKYSYALFDCKIVKEVYLSEDFLFCQRWLDLGGKIYAYFKANLTHTGLYRYQGNVMSRLYDS